MSLWTNSSYFVVIYLSTTLYIMRWSFYSRMIGRNKYLDCFLSLNNTFKNNTLCSENNTHFVFLHNS